MPTTKIIAHRGASGYRPENTLEAFKLAIEQKADGIELDVHLTKDKKVVVAHDERLERVSNDGVGLINDYTLEQLKKLNFNKHFTELGKCSIPTLAEVYELVKGTNLTLNVELKTTTLLYPELPQKLCELEKQYNMENRVIYSSFNHYSLLKLKQIEPKAKIGLLYQFGMVDPWIYANYLKADAIHPHYAIITTLPKTIKNCHENGILVNVWTVDDPKLITYLCQCQVDSIITNKPDIAINCRKKL